MPEDHVKIEKNTIQFVENKKRERKQREEGEKRREEGEKAETENEQMGSVYCVQ